MADIEEVNYPSGGRRADSPVDIESRNEREGSRESDHDDRDRRRRGGGYERDLRRENRRYAPYPSQDERSGRRQSGSSGKECRVYVWNLPYNVKWQDLKDFMKTVGEVGHVDIIEDGHGKSKGCGIVEFRHKEDAEKAIKELHGTDFRGRSIHIREDRIEETQSERRRPTSSRGTDSGNYGSNHSPQIGGGGLGNLTNLLGMGNLNVAQGLNYKTDPLSCTVFVSNLDYNVNWQKLKDTFRVAGNVIRADINLDSDHKSKGFGTVQFETATEAISAVYFIAMFHGQNLSGRAMSVRLDRNAPIMQQLSNAGMNNVNMGRTAASGAMNQVAVLQLLQSLQGLSQLAQLTSNLNNAGGGLGAALGSLTGGGGIAGLGATPGMADPSATNPLAALSGLGMLGNNLGLGGAGGGGGGGLGVGGGLGSLSQGDSGAPGKQVFVRNLPWRYTWQDLKDKFKGAGRVVRADIMTESGGRSKGCGTVMFETAEDAAHAISLFNGALIDGREIDVRMDRLG